MEYAISGAKRLGCVTQVNLNKSDAFNDWDMMLACGVWNGHLRAVLRSVYRTQPVQPHPWPLSPGEGSLTIQTRNGIRL